MTKRKVIKQIKAKVKTEIEWSKKGLYLRFGKNIIGDTIILNRPYFHHGVKDRYMCKKRIVMDLYRIKSLGKNSLRHFSKASLEIMQDEIAHKLIQYIKEWGSEERMFQ